jgi:predicted transposase YbfD/YdcC
MASITGAVVTSDAMSCQITIAAQICEKGADYFLALNGNAGLIYDAVFNNDVIGDFST